MTTNNDKPYNPLSSILQSIQATESAIQALRDTLLCSSSQFALKKLVEGNRRFANENQDHPRSDQNRREQVTLAQNPFAVILCCADSRVSPEIIFDQGIGDLFVIRVAGNIATPEVIASIEYAVEHLSPSLLIVLGHENCGAVNAACNAAQGANNLKVLLDYITISLSGKIADLKNPELVAKQHAISTATHCVNESSIISTALLQNSLTIAAGYYSLSTGVVEFLDFVRKSTMRETSYMKGLFDM